MGNSFPTDKCINAGINGSIEFEHAVYCENWKTYLLSYRVGSKDVLLSLNLFYGNNGLITDLKFSFYKHRPIFSFDIKAENNILNLFRTDKIREAYETNFVNESKNQWGVVTKTNIGCQWGEHEGDLLVVEQKRKKGVERPCAMKVAHYYAFSKQSFISWRKYEVGLSVVVDIKVLNNDLDVSMKGPIEHPTLALLQMFQQVSRTWSWNWTACSHCAAQTQMQQSETESENDNEEINYLQWSRKIGGNILANQGVIKGNNNVNLVVNKLFLRGN